MPSRLICVVTASVPFFRNEKSQAKAYTFCLALLYEIMAIY